VAWLSITLELDAAQADLLSEALMEAGAESVALEPVVDAAGPRTRLTALAAASTDPAVLVSAAAQAAALAAPAFSVARVADEDWIGRSQSQFGPVRISAALCIVPSWHRVPDDAGTVVRVDPGLAFGTGSHVSTRLVLQHLEALLRQAGFERARVLDYGCGSGILAIAAAKLGAADVAAVDIDPQALATTAANAGANGVSLRVTAPESLPAGTYDVVLANILAGPLIALQPLLASRTRPGGRIALSGILESQAAEVVASYARDFDAAVSATDEGWALVAGRRR
jgi:ribosomal protein L11 methyltransferase